METKKSNNESDYPYDKDILLKVEGISKYFGAMAALKDLSFNVFSGEIFGIAGPNGAGKTTLFNVITKFLNPDGGKIQFKDKYIHKLNPNKICELGIARTFQIPALFESLTTYQNALVGAAFGNTDKDRNKLNLVKKNLEFFGLWEKKDIIADELSLYERKALMVASALTTEPEMLLLDEPTAGLSKIESDHVMELFKKINNRDVAIIIIEHNMDVLMNISERVMILDHGEKICEGPPGRVCKDEGVIEAYLGEEFMIER